MWSVSSLPSTRRDRAVTRKSKYLNFDRRHRMRRLSTFSLNSSVFELACAARVLGNNVAIAEKLVFIDRKSTRLNSSHGYISYAVFCLKKKKKQINQKDYRRYVAMTRRRHG